MIIHRSWTTGKVDAQRPEEQSETRARAAGAHPVPDGRGHPRLPGDGLWGPRRVDESSLQPFCGYASRERGLGLSIPPPRG